MDIWIPVIVAIITASVAYFGSVHKNKIGLNALRIKNESDIEKLEKEQTALLNKIETEHKNEMDKMTSQFEKALKLQENETVNNITRDFFPEKTLNKMGEKILNSENVQELIMKSILNEMDI